MSKGSRGPSNPAAAALSPDPSDMEQAKIFVMVNHHDDTKKEAQAEKFQIPLVLKLRKPSDMEQAKIFAMVNHHDDIKKEALAEKFQIPLVLKLRKLFRPSKAAPVNSLWLG